MAMNSDQIILSDYLSIVCTASGPCNRALAQVFVIAEASSLITCSQIKFWWRVMCKLQRPIDLEGICDSSQYFHCQFISGRISSIYNLTNILLLVFWEAKTWDQDRPAPFPPSRRQRVIWECELRIVHGPTRPEARSRSAWTRAWTRSRASCRSQTPSRSAPRAPLLPPGQPVKDVLNIQSRIRNIRNYFSVVERHQQTLWLNPGSRILASTRRKRKDKNKEKLQSIDKTIR